VGASLLAMGPISSLKKTASPPTKVDLHIP